MTTYMIKANDLGIGRSIRRVSSRLYSVYDNVVGSLRPLGSVPRAVSFGQVQPFLESRLTKRLRGAVRAVPCGQTC